jgi:hypothetical protein
VRKKRTPAATAQRGKKPQKQQSRHFAPNAPKTGITKKTVKSDQFWTEHSQWICEPSGKAATSFPSSFRPEMNLAVSDRLLQKRGWNALAGSGILESESTILVPSGNGSFISRSASAGSSLLYLIFEQICSGT